MPLNENIFIHAVAGSGKTTYLVELALQNPDKKILITTYTNKNTQEIEAKIKQLKGFIPKNIKICGWFSFLLNDGCRPYQKLVGINSRINDVELVVKQSAPYVPERDIEKYYFNSTGAIYSDKISQFVVKCNTLSNGKVLSRIEKCYDYIFIDESQDFSGWDFDFLNLLLQSHCKLVIVGDKRQTTFNTTPSNKNKKYSEDIHLWFDDKQKENWGILHYFNKCWRCNKYICNFADLLFPELPPSEPRELVEGLSHKGLYYLKKSNLDKYIQTYSPIILVYDKRAKKRVNNYPTINWGNSKGTTLERTIIVPTKPILEYLKSGDITKINDKDKFYIALTRAKHSIAFLVEDSENLSSYYFEQIKVLE